MEPRWQAARRRRRRRRRCRGKEGRLEMRQTNVSFCWLRVGSARLRRSTHDVFPLAWRPTIVTSRCLLQNRLLSQENSPLIRDDMTKRGEGWPGESMWTGRTADTVQRCSEDVVSGADTRELGDETLSPTLELMGGGRVQQQRTTAQQIRTSGRHNQYLLWTAASSWRMERKRKLASDDVGSK